MGKIVALYNNKGGVSKTTTTFNLAVHLTQSGKHVLLADCDPQCNMTELFFAANTSVDDPDTELPGTSIYEAMLPRFRGQLAEIDQSTVSLPEHVRYKGLFLLKGDIEFSRAETYFGTAWNQAVTENIHEKNTYVSLEKLLRSLVISRQYDYVLCDVGPSTGAITRTVILACNEVIIPLVPDRFCYQAVKLLGKVIGEWMERHKIIADTLAPFGIESFEGKPLLAGTVLQNFKVHAGARAKESYIKWQERIQLEIQNSLVSKSGMIAKDNFDPSHPFTAAIKDVAVLAPIAQLFGRAIFDIEQEHTKEASTDGRMYYGSVWDPWVIRMNEYKKQISNLSQAIL